MSNKSDRGVVGTLTMGHQECPITGGVHLWQHVQLDIKNDRSQGGLDKVHVQTLGI